MVKSNPEQLQASNPLDSVWVAASAGTGKTKVLTDRVLRLLLQGAKPETILCLTYTKAAASEMENRINSVLKDWALYDNAKLIEKIVELTQEEPDEDLLNRAKSLFAKTLETPGGMKIMTIHAFCQSLLKRFPLEADVPPHFEVIDDLMAKTMREQIMNDVLSLPDMQEDLDALTDLISTNVLADLFKNILEKASLYEELLDVYPNGIETLFHNINKYFRIDKYHTENEIINEFCKTEEWPVLKEQYLTDSDTILDNKKKDPKAYEVFEVNERLRSWHIAIGTQHLLRIIFKIINVYRNMKTQAALLDYTDLLTKAHMLLSQSSMTQWVLYKLDGGVDHILLDEAQDTNKTAWKIIEAIANEFFAGEGQTDKNRTLFVVGDKKQSIFSFQGADPAVFEQMRDHFEQAIRNSKNTFQPVDLNYSFRSTEPVLRLVNYVLQNEHAKNGVLFGDETAYHQTDRCNDAGLVEIWPVVKVENKDLPDAWTPPTKREELASSMKQMIDSVVDKIESMIGKETLASKGRLIQPGDILILLQKRTNMMAEFVRALQNKGIPVAGVDRLKLSNYLAIQDLMSLTEFTLQPENNLNLANLIKSPVLNLKESDLYQLCVRRGKESVWSRLQKLYPEKAEILKEIIYLSERVPPFEFYGRVLGAFHLRRAFVARFGREVNEALDEFLNLTLDFEQNHTPSLQGFLNWFSNHEIEIKRDLDNSGINAVRIMTVHGSKGLQGNIVFLPDTRSNRFSSPKGGEVVWDKGLPFWIPNKQLRPRCMEDVFANRDSLAAQERRRLLYVALTRASDRIYICGCDGKQKAPANNWYDLIVNSLPSEIMPDSDGIIRWGSEQTVDPEDKQKEKFPFDETEIPDWVYDMPPEEKMPETPLSPSKLVAEENEQTGSVLDKARDYAMRRGILIHKLLQFLPSIEPEQRADYIAKIAATTDVHIPNNLLEIFDRSDLKDFFGPSSAPEVPVVGTWNGKPISGQIDRLVILPTEVKIVDFKTNHVVPEKMPDAYKKQLEAYRDLLKTIFPDKIIRTYILWIQNLTCEEVK